MSKEISDMMGKLKGDLLALEGMEARISPPPPAPPPTIEQAALPVVPAAKAKREDVDFVKKLAEEIQGICKDLVAQVDKENQIPPLPGDEQKSESGSANAPVSTSSASGKK